MFIGGIFTGVNGWHVDLATARGPVILRHWGRGGGGHVMLYGLYVCMSTDVYCWCMAANFATKRPGILGEVGENTGEE